MQRSISSSFSSLTIRGTDDMKRCELCLSSSTRLNASLKITTSTMGRCRIGRASFALSGMPANVPPFHSAKTRPTNCIQGCRFASEKHRGRRCWRVIIGNGKTHSLTSRRSVLVPSIAREGSLRPTCQKIRLSRVEDDTRCLGDAQLVDVETA